MYEGMKPLYLLLSISTAKTIQLHYVHVLIRSGEMVVVAAVLFTCLVYILVPSASAVKTCSHHWKIDVENDFAWGC